MSQHVTLAIPQHDPEGYSLSRWQTQSTALQSIFASIVAYVSPETHNRVKKALTSFCSLVEENDPGWSPEGVVLAGKFRRQLMALALRTDSPYIMYCDGDRLLHWLEHHADELASVVERIPEHDFTVLGRTGRAFRSHPATQYDTERIVNCVFARISGHEWDVTAAARGLSRVAAQVIVGESNDDTFGNDASWPLLIQQHKQLTMAEIKTEGLEYETAQKYADATAKMGGDEQWKAQIDSNPLKWLNRLNLARIEVESMLPYWTDPARH